MLDLDVLQATAEAVEQADDWFVGTEVSAKTDNSYDIEFIAAASPEVVLALIAELRQAREERDMLAGAIAKRDALNRAILAEAALSRTWEQDE